MHTANQGFRFQIKIAVAAFLEVFFYCFDLCIFLMIFFLVSKSNAKTIVFSKICYIIYIFCSSNSEISWMHYIL